MKKTLLTLMMIAGASSALAQSPAPNPFMKPSSRPPVAEPQNIPPPHMDPHAMPFAPDGSSPPMDPLAFPGGFPGMGGVPLPEVEGGPEREVVKASRIGKVNGLHIFKSEVLYHFEEDSVREIQLKVENDRVEKKVTAPQEVLGGLEPRPNLPSAVGQPTPR